jgi:hypothetical protein
VADGIYYSEKLVQSLELSLRSAFNRPFLTLTRRPKNAGGGFPVSLTDGYMTVQADEGWEYAVEEILTASGQPTKFYFGFVATFGLTTRQYALQASSLIVFQDIGMVTPLFRAEWDREAASDGKSEHAQPHWHFMQRPHHIEGIVRLVSNPSTEFAPEQTSELFAGLTDSTKFHFAMSTRWDQDIKPLYKEMFETNDFPKWFQSLATYIAGQIRYLVSKSPQTLQEFAPEP